MQVEIHRDGLCYELEFEHGENIGGLKKSESSRKQSGTRIRWKPDIQVFTDIDIPADYYRDILKRQAIVNNGLLFVFRNQTDKGFETEEFLYENGIEDYVKEIAGDTALTLSLIHI